MGVLSDHIGYRRAFGLGAASITAGSILSAAAPSLALLDAARILAGLGAAAVLTGATSILSNAFSGRARTHAFAVFGTVNGLGLALGPTISGALVSGFGWRGVFAVHAIILGTTTAMSRVLPGGQARVHGEHRAPVIDVALLRNREFLAMCLVPVAGSVGFVTLLTYLPSALSGIKDVSPGETGLVMLALTVPVLLAPLAVARIMALRPRVRVGAVIHLSLGALVLGNAGTLLLTQAHPVVWVIVPLVLLGLGFGLPIGLVDGHALAVVPADRAGTAAGLLNFFRIGSEAVFVAGYAALLSSIVGRHLTGRAAETTSAGQYTRPDIYRSAFDTTVATIIVLLLVITAIIALVRSRARGIGAEAA